MDLTRSIPLKDMCVSCLSSSNNNGLSTMHRVFLTMCSRSLKKVSEFIKPDWLVELMHPGRPLAAKVFIFRKYKYWRNQISNSISCNYYGNDHSPICRCHRSYLFHTFSCNVSVGSLNSGETLLIYIVDNTEIKFLAIYHLF